MWSIGRPTADTMLMIFLKYSCLSLESRIPSYMELMVALPFLKLTLASDIID